MEKQQVGLISNGLKCDNVECDWSDKTIELEDYKENINKKCPNCGENVLTLEDYNNVQKVLKILASINLPKVEYNGEEQVTMEIHTHKNISLGEIQNLKELSKDWWQELIESDSCDDMERKHGYYGHDIGSNEMDILNIFKMEFNIY